MDPHSLAQQILIRSFWYRVANPHISDADARNAAAAELAEEHRREARHARRPIPQSNPRQANDPRSRLLGRMVGMVERLARPRTAPTAQATTTAATSEPAKPTWVQRVMAAFEPEPQPPPEPAPQQPMVRAENSSASLIPDNEFSQRFRDPVTANWRASVESNVTKFPEKRGYPKTTYVG
jgi:hypothetical protein